MIQIWLPCLIKYIWKQSFQRYLKRNFESAQTFLSYLGSVLTYWAFHVSTYDHSVQFDNPVVLDIYILQRLHCELPNAVIRQIPDCGHLPHVEKPSSVAKMIVELVQQDQHKEVQCIPQFWRLTFQLCLILNVLVSHSQPHGFVAFAISNPAMLFYN